MYHRILLPVALEQQGRGEVALAVAEALAAPDARVTLIHVREPIPAFVAGHIPEEALEARRAQAEAALAALAAKTRLTVDQTVVAGHPARAIVDYADSHQVDCIILASHHPGVSDYFLGSTAAWVARHADCSIHVIR